MIDGCRIGFVRDAPAASAESQPLDAAGRSPVRIELAGVGAGGARRGSGIAGVDLSVHGGEIVAHDAKMRLSIAPGSLVARDMAMTLGEGRIAGEVALLREAGAALAKFGRCWVPQSA